MAKAKKKAAKKPAKKTAKKVAKKIRAKVPARKSKKPVRKMMAKKAAKKVAKTAPKKFAKKIAAKKAAKPVKKIAVKAPAKPPAKAVSRIVPKRKGMNGLPEQMFDAALKVLDERQAEDIFTADLAGKSAVADYMIVASGRAARQVAAIAQYLREAFAKLGVTQVRVEGASEGNWVLVDAGDVIIHLFRPEVRRYYAIESLWDGSRKPEAAENIL